MKFYTNNYTLILYKNSLLSVQINWEGQNASLVIKVQQHICTNIASSSFIHIDIYIAIVGVIMWEVCIPIFQRKRKALSRTYANTYFSFLFLPHSYHCISFVPYQSVVAIRCVIKFSMPNKKEGMCIRG